MPLHRDADIERTSRRLREDGSTISHYRHGRRYHDGVLDSGLRSCLAVFDPESLAMAVQIVDVAKNPASAEGVGLRMEGAAAPEETFETD